MKTSAFENVLPVFGRLAAVNFYYGIARKSLIGVKSQRSVLIMSATLNIPYKERTFITV